MKLKPPAGKKLVRDWAGLRVKTVRELRNGVTLLPVGSLAIVDHVGRTGLHLTIDACPHCGVRIFMTRVSHTDVEVAP